MTWCIHKIHPNSDIKCQGQCDTRAPSHRNKPEVSICRETPSSVGSGRSRAQYCCLPQQNTTLSVPVGGRASVRELCDCHIRGLMAIIAPYRSHQRSGSSCLITKALSLFVMYCYIQSSSYCAAPTCRVTSVAISVNTDTSKCN